MRILLVSDIHMALLHLDRLIARAGQDIDLISCAGDLTNWGSRADMQSVVGKLRDKPLLTIPGNLDTAAGQRYLEEEGFSIHGTERTINGWTFVGFGGGNTDFVGDILYSEAQVTEALEPLLQSAPAATTMLVTHQPPFDTKLDRVGGVRPHGSPAIRRLIEQYQPCYQICGHIHESWGEDQLGRTRCFNIAAVKEGRAATLDLATGAFTRLTIG